MQLCCHQRVLGTHCSALTKAVQSSVLLVVWADNQGFRRQHHQGTSWALKFRSQDSKLKSIWETGLKRCFSLFGLCLNDPRLRGLGLPRSQARGVDAWYPWGFIPILKSLAAKIASRGEIIGTSSPYWDEMMMTNVKQFQIPRFPNDKRFQTKLCAEVVSSVSKLWATQKDGYGVWFVGLLFSAATALWWSKDGAKETRFS